MFIARSEYDRGINTFSPEGRLFQVEYSLEAIKLGSTAIGVATGGGVVLGVEKRVTSTLLETSSVEKIVEIDRHIGCAMSGLQADARSMVEHARVESQNHAFNYNEPLRVESCTQAICDLALRFGEGADGEESIMSRPFGVALLIAGFDEDGPQLYHAEPSGTFYRYDAKAIGSGSEGAQAELQNEFHKSLTVEEAAPSHTLLPQQIQQEHAVYGAEYPPQNYEYAEYSENIQQHSLLENVPRDFVDAFVGTGQVKEINQKSIMGDSSVMRQQRMNTTKKEMGKFGLVGVVPTTAKPSLLQKRKHQLSSLVWEAQQKELELMERGAASNKTKLVTRGKYGW